jgi:hypothetical protein
MALSNTGRRERMDMQKLLAAAVVLGIFAVLPTAASANVRGGGCNTSKNGSADPMPAWDQQFPDGSSRFVCLSDWGNAAVLDQETGLVWERAPRLKNILVWIDALSFCHTHAIANRFGWRLPTVEEMSSLLDPGQPNVALPPGHPFVGIAAGELFWTASTIESNTTEAYYIAIGQGVVGPVTKDTALQLWCVRGGSGAQNPVSSGSAVP